MMFQKRLEESIIKRIATDIKKIVSNQSKMIFEQKWLEKKIDPLIIGYEIKSFKEERLLPINIKSKPTTYSAALVILAKNTTVF